MIVFLFLVFAQTELPEQNVRELRREYVQSGMTAYTEGNYRETVLKLKKAFALDSTDAPVAYNIACCYSLMDMKDSAISWIERTIGLGTYDFSEDKDFDNIRKVKEFQELTVQAESLLVEARGREWPSCVFIPSDYDSKKFYPILFMLHGYGTSPDDFTHELAKFFTKKGFIYVVPYGTEIFGLSSFGWGSVEKVEDKILSDIKDIKKKYSIDTTCIILAGYSQGGGRTFSIAIRNPYLFRGAVSIAGYFDEENLKDYLKELDNKNLKFYIMIGGKERKEMFKSNQRAIDLLRTHGLKVHLKVFPEVGHAFPSTPEEVFEKALDFILEK